MNAELDQIIRTLAVALLGNDEPEHLNYYRDPHWREHRAALLADLREHDHEQRLDRQHRRDDTKKRFDAAALAEDAEWLIRSGEHPDNIAARLGYGNRDNLHRALARLNRTDLTTALDPRKATAA